MKKIIQFALVIWILGCTFSCSHNRYPQKTNSNVSAIQHSSEPYFLFISDIHLDIAVEHTDSSTDTGMDLWNIFKIKIDSVLSSANPPSFVLCTGDLPAHYKCNGSCLLTGDKLQKHNKELTIVLTDLRNLVSRYKIPLFYVPGNNDALSGDYYSFANGDGQTLFSLVPDIKNPYPALNTYSAITGNFATTPYIVSMPDPKMGYYSVVALSGLRIIALNSVIWGNKYEPADNVSQVDAGNEEMNWLASQLQDAKTKGEKVYIAMHIPPGIDAYKFDQDKKPYTNWAILPSVENSWLKTFLRLTTAYQATICGIFYGHTHMDEMRLLYDSTGQNVTEVAISSPGITPQHGNNPGFKSVSFDSTSKKLLNFTTYYTNLPVAGSWGNQVYRFSSVFSCNEKYIYDFVQAQSLETIDGEMRKIYTVMHGSPAYHTVNGIPIK
jgi:sphingomyelin phosphodiesterase acid-like 3